jgi:enoyl-CoA hydratase/carnithine racemase
MYDALADACRQADEDEQIRALIIRGSGGSFAAGTDISQFADFRTGDDGVAYERRLEAMIDRLEQVTVPTVAEVDGAAVGGGCLLALACDLRLGSPAARFGIPVARTLGNCLSMANMVRVVDLIGPARTRDLMLTGRLLDADEAHALGLLTRIVPGESLDDEALRLARDLTTRAGSTVRATRQMLLRLRALRTPPPGTGDDIVAECYGSADFREGVTAFREGRRPEFG